MTGREFCDCTSFEAPDRLPPKAKSDRRLRSFAWAIKQIRRGSIVSCGEWEAEDYPRRTYAYLTGLNDTEILIVVREDGLRTAMRFTYRDIRSYKWRLCEQLPLTAEAT